MTEKLDGITIEINNTLLDAYNVLPQEARKVIDAIAAKDAYTAGHCVRVAILTSRICDYKCFSFEKGYKYFVAAALHDIGKLAISDEVLTKPSKLTDEEFVEMKQHTTAGIELAKLFNVTDKLVLAAAGMHHQHFAGGNRSYPFEVEGKAIPEIARIIAVADSVDAILSKRVYDEARSSADCYLQVLRGRGTQFDPEFSLCVLSHWQDFVGGLYPQV